MAGSRRAPRAVQAPTHGGHCAGSITWRNRWIAGGCAAAQLEHTNLVPVYDIGVSGDTHIIVMELISGESLAHRLARKKALGLGDAVAVALFVAKALAHAWQRGRLVHRDLRPENIFIARDGEIKLGDLGLAACHPADAANPASAYYVSPEQGRADRVLDFRSDIYSLGCVLFHLLTGAPPYSGDTPDAVIEHELDLPEDLLLHGRAESLAVPPKPDKQGEDAGKPPLRVQ